jgi:predicted nucleic acid-binding protein
MVEDGSDLVVELWARCGRAVSSILCHPEGRAAIAAARCGGRLSASAYGDAIEDFDALHGELHLVGIDKSLARHAGRLADELGLGGYDAVHLASALALGSDTIVVTWDGDLGQAASSIGCGVASAW